MAQALINAPVATVKGGFWAQYGVSVSGLGTGGALRRDAAMALSKRGTRPLRKIATVLNGAAPGSNATLTETRIAAAEELGGKRTIETVELVNATTTTAHRDTINADVLSYPTWVANPVANLDGNPLGTR